MPYVLKIEVFILGGEGGGTQPPLSEFSGSAPVGLHVRSHRLLRIINFKKVLGSNLHFVQKAGIQVPNILRVFTGDSFAMIFTHIIPAFNILSGS